MREAIGGLERTESLGERRHRFRFPAQQHKVDRGDSVIDPVTGATAGVIEQLDDVEGTLTLRLTKKAEELTYPTRLIPGGPYDTDPANKERASARALARCWQWALSGTRKSAASRAAARW